jgi:hypothetical protein
MAGRQLFRRTEAGTAAWQRQDARVPLEYRRLLGLIEGDTHPDDLRARFPSLSEAATARLLDVLVEQKLVEAVEELDFFGSFDLVDLTSSFSLNDFSQAAG